MWKTDFYSHLYRIGMLSFYAYQLLLRRAYAFGHAHEDFVQKERLLHNHCMGRILDGVLTSGVLTKQIFRPVVFHKLSKLCQCLYYSGVSALNLHLSDESP